MNTFPHYLPTKLDEKQEAYALVEFIAKKDRTIWIFFVNLNFSGPNL